MVKVSVCVPVYNVEQFIGRCIESIKNQLYKDLEIIIVNDCTPDNSMQIVEQYAKTDPRIRIINHEKNGGLMMARRTGYMAATGDYITFCDSDDTLPKEAVEVLLKAAIDNGSDISSGNMTYIDTNGKESMMSSSLKYGNDKISVFKSLLLHEMGHNLCSKLFKREILQNHEYITYEHFTNGEDGCLFYQVVDNCEKIVQIQESVYNYYQNIKSSSQVHLSLAGIESIVLLNKTRESICSKYDIISKYLFRCISTILNNLYSYGYNKNGLLTNEVRKKNVEKYIDCSVMSEYFSKAELLKILLKRQVMPFYYKIK